MRTILFFFLFTLSWQLSAQNSSLAAQYLRKGEYEKAAQMYKDLYEARNSKYYLEKYISSLLPLKSYDEAKMAVEQHLKSRPQDISIAVLKGKILEKEGKIEEAEKIYSKALQNLPNNKSDILRLGSRFTRDNKLDLAIKTYEKGAEILDDPYAFANNLANLYRSNDEDDKMVEQYLLIVENQESRLKLIMQYFQRFLEKEQLSIVQEKIYERISMGKESPAYPELLSWVAIQREDYPAALLQLRSQYLRGFDVVDKIYELGSVARQAGDTETAISAYDYIMENEAEDNTYYISAYMSKLGLLKKMAISRQPMDRDELLRIDKMYEEFLDRMGKSSKTSSIMLTLAEYNLTHLDKPEKALHILDELIEMPGGNSLIVAKAKLKKADYYLLTGNRWDATLLYSQVDKEFPESDMGELARYKNAMLSYYMKDFGWAKQQFDILKVATSRVISNDAIDMSVFIADNLMLDTTTVAMELYADAELLLYRYRYEEAIRTLDALEVEFPEHKLRDDILFLKGKIYEERQDALKAEEMYLRIIENHPDEIRADNAMFRLAELYDRVLEKPSKAREFYKKLFLEYEDSTFAVTARKRYREMEENL